MSIPAGSASAYLRTLLPVALFVLGLALTVVVWNRQVETRNAERTTYFEFRSRDAAARILSRLSQYEQALLYARALVQTVDPITAPVFSRYIAGSEVQTRFPGIQGIGFSAVIVPALPGSGPVQKTSILYLEPLNARNQRAIGYDMYSELVRRTAMSRAAETGQPALSGKVRLVQETETDVQAGFLLYVPVYRPGPALLGWVYAPFRMNDFMAGVLGEAAGDLDLKIYDGDQLSPKTVLFDSDPSSRTSADPALSLTQELNFAGHSWTLVTRGLSGLAQRQGTDFSVLILVMGSVISVLVALLGLVLLNQWERVRLLNASLAADVSARTQDLEKEQKRLSAIIRGTNVGTWEWNIQTGETVFSERWAQITGYTLAELSPVSIQTWGALGHPDDLRKSEALLKRHFDGELEYYALECRMRHKDGHWVWVLDRGAVATRTADGKPEWMYGTHTEITERKVAEDALRRSEQKFAGLFQLLPVGVVLTNETGQIVEANEGAQAILGLTASETLARTYDAPSWSLVRPDGSVMPAEEYASVRAMTEDRPVVDVEMGVLRPDGQVRWLLTSSSPMHVADLGVCIVFIDITERKRAEEVRAELEQQNQQLKKGQSLAQMAGSIAHLFNNKLQAVLSDLELAKSVRLGDDPTPYLSRAESAALSASEVSRLLLAYLGQSSLNREPCNLGPIVQESVAVFRRSLSPGIRLSVAPAAPELFIRANAEQLRQVVTQLLANASESLADETGTLTVRLAACGGAEISAVHRFPLAWQPQDGRYTLVEVIDTGSGIAEADFEKLFDPFYTTKFTGRGLGLAVILGIVRAHGGAVTVESQLGRGSTFRVYLPVWQGALPAEPRSPVPAARSALGKVLLVDDEPSLLESLAELLEMLGFSVLTARDGLEAVEVFQKQRDDIRCILTDLTMPNLDGWGLLQAVRELEPDLPVYLASGYDRAQVLSGDHAHLPTDYVSKPFNLEELRRILGAP